MARPGGARRGGHRRPMRAAGRSLLRRGCSWAGARGARRGKNRRAAGARTGQPPRAALSRSARDQRRASRAASARLGPAPRVGSSAARAPCVGRQRRSTLTFSMYSGDFTEMRSKGVNV
eukprot:scaffold291728_cov28-Tisochrysis_lutea.AAC.1